MTLKPPALVSTGAAARELGVSGMTLRRWTEAGRIRPARVTVGGHARWNMSDLRAQIDQMTLVDVPAEPEPQAEPEPAPAAAKRTPDRPVRLPQDKRTRRLATEPAQVEPRPGLGPKRIGEQSD